MRNPRTNCWTGKDRQALVLVRRSRWAGSLAFPSNNDTDISGLTFACVNSVLVHEYVGMMGKSFQVISEADF